MKELYLIRERFCTAHLTPGGSEDPLERNKALALLASLKARDSLCFWEDIAYTDCDRASWQTMEHLIRIEKIILALGSEYWSKEEMDTALLLSALDYWLIHDFQNPNWWYNEIGVPRALGNIALFLFPHLSTARHSRICLLVARGSMAKNRAILEVWTGANLIWGAANTLRHALLTEDESLLALASDAAARELTVAQNEGIQLDGSFFQHGRRLYSGGYGRSFAYDMALFAYLLHATSYRFSTESLHALMLHLLDGICVMSHRGMLDWACVGREMTRINNLNLRALIPCLHLLLAIPELPRRDALSDFFSYVIGEKTKDRTRYFPIAAMLCHHFDGIYVGAKFLNDTTMGAEICNSEGELCYNMSYGTHTCIMQNGNEYYNLFPCFDYSRIPGTTSRHENDEQLLAHKGWENQCLPNPHSGGGQVQSHAAIYELAEHDGITALVSFFSFTHGFACLGTEIRDATPEKGNLFTTVEQCRRMGDLQYEDGSILHNGVRYTPLNKTPFLHQIAEQRGSWNRNNRALSSDIISEQVLTITIPHKPDSVGAYAYLISAAALPCPRIQVVANTKLVQAIQLENGKILAVFHEEGDLILENRIIHAQKGVYLEE